MRARHTLSALILVGLTAFAALPAGAATVTIINNDDPGEGFNDPTPVTPVGGNPGTTLGQQRLIAAQAAADRWGELLSSDVEIEVSAEFNPMFCNASGVTFGSAGTRTVHINFANAPFPGTYYPAALANALAGNDLNGVLPDITAQFNSNLDDDPACPWYWWYGIDGSSFPYEDNLASHLFAVLMHEMGHGLGMQNFVDYSTGQFIFGFPDIYSRFTFDTTTGLHWHEMTDPQRFASARNTNNVVLDGPENKIEADAFLTANNVDLVVNTGPAAGTYAGVGALFGAPYPTTDGLTLDMEEVDDGVPPTNDGCEPLVGFTPGRIAFVNRGTCEFGVKALNAEQAGADAVIIANNIGGTALLLMAPGAVGRQVTVPTNMITQNDGDTIRPTLPVNGTFNVIDVYALHANGFPLVYAPNPIEPGSSIAHYDPTAGPNALMEPFLNPDLYDDPDMTLGLYRDEGWVTGGPIFADGFESGDVSAWSSSVP